MGRALFAICVLTLIGAGCANAPVEPSEPDQQNEPMQEQESSVEGLNIEVLKEGGGQVAKAGDTVSVHYTGTLEDGTKFDSSRDRGAPFEFPLGAGMVIKGWDLGVEGMQIGEQRKLTIDAALGYGDRGVPGVIPAGATLIFDVELLGIE